MSDDGAKTMKKSIDEFFRKFEQAKIHNGNLPQDEPLPWAYFYFIERAMEDALLEIEIEMLGLVIDYEIENKQGTKVLRHRLGRKKKEYEKYPRL